MSKFVSEICFVMCGSLKLPSRISFDHQLQIFSYKLAPRFRLLFTVIKIISISLHFCAHIKVTKVVDCNCFKKKSVRFPRLSGKKIFKTSDDIDSQQQPKNYQCKEPIKLVSLDIVQLFNIWIWHLMKSALDFTTYPWL